MAATLKHIAYITNTSIATVSKVLSGKELSVSDSKRSEILEVAQKLNYTSDQRYKKSREAQKHLSVVVPDLVDLLTLRLMEGITDVAAKSGYSVSVFVSNNDTSQEIEHIYNTFNNGSDGIILIPVAYKATKAQKELLSRVLDSLDVPTMVLGDILNTTHYGSVAVDAYRKGYIAANHLIENGHERVAFITTHSDEVQDDCLLGFKKCFEENDLVWDEELLFPNSLRYIGARASFHKALEKGVSAMFFTSDVLALGSISEARKINLKIPDDISFMSGENTSQMRKNYYAIDSVNFPAGDVSRIVIDMLDDMIKANRDNAEPQRAKQVLIMPELKVYGSVKPFAK